MENCEREILLTINSNRRPVITALLLLSLFTSLTFAQNPSLELNEHIQAELTSAIKLAKAKAGDSLKAATVAPVQLDNGQNVPTGSILLGRILRVEPNALTLKFDEASINGKHLPLTMTLSGIAFMGPSGQQMSEKSGPSQLDSPSGGNSPNDHPLNGAPYSVVEAGNNALSGVSHETLAEINAKPSNASVTRGPSVPAHAGSVINLPGVKLSIQDQSPFSSTLEFETNQKQQLPKGVQLMFSVR